MSVASALLTWFIIFCSAFIAISIAFDCRSHTSQNSTQRIVEVCRNGVVYYDDRFYKGYSLKFLPNGKVELCKE